jgi:hypothetical protein
MLEIAAYLALVRGLSPGEEAGVSSRSIWFGTSYGKFW